MIPKKIHFCWFGGNEKPASVQKCIESWKKYAPDYEIIEWNESNFDVHQTPYLEYCYQNKKWPFLSDLARLIILEQEGGIYFDTDVELIKEPTDFLQYNAFFGFEIDSAVATGLGFGTVAHQESMKLMIQEYTELTPNEAGEYPLTPCPALNTKALQKMGLQTNGKKQVLRGNVLILPADYMNPFDDPTGRLVKTENTISIHWYSKSWMDRKTILRSKLTRPLHRMFGEDCFKWIKRK